MADRYWVGGSGNWDTTDTSHWSTSSGGAGGASVPTSSDNVFFDSNSSTGDFSIPQTSGTKSCNNITFSTTNILSFSVSVSVSGNITFNGNVAFKNNALFSIVGSSRTIDISTNSTNDGSLVTDGLSIYCVSNQTINITGDAYFNTLRLDNSSSLLGNSYDITINTLIALTSSSITMSGGQLLATRADIDITLSSLELSTGRSLVVQLGAAQNANITSATVDSTGSSSTTIISGSGGITAGTIGTLTLVPSSQTYKFQAGRTLNLTSFNASGNYSLPVTLRSTTTSSRFTLNKTSGSIDLQDVDIKDSNASGGATWSARSSTDSGNNTGWIFVAASQREAKGAFVIGGQAVRKAIAPREAKGAFTLGGSAQAFIRKNTGQIEEKIYLAKVYDEDGSFLEVWRDELISEPSFTQEINEIGSSMTLELARNSDSVATTTEPLQTEAGATLTTESGLSILASTESRNQVGPGSAVNHNNRVDIFVFYGGVEPLLTELGEEILTEDGEVLLAVNGAPNGRRIFTGFISEINSRYGSSETTIIELSSYGWDLGQYPITTDTGDTTVPFNSYEPSQMVREAIDKFEDDSAGDGTYTTRTTTSISNTGTTTSYTFKVNTYEDVLKKAIELMPEGWYFYIGLGDNTVYFREKAEEATHTFYLGKHIKDLDLKSYIGDSTNRVIFTGGGEPALLKDYTETPASHTRRRLERISDGRVELESSAELISQGTIDEKNKVQYRTTIEILSKQYDIESINIGDMVGFRNFGNYVDGLVMQIVGLTYNSDVITLQLDTNIPNINKRIEDVARNLKTTENINVPDAPTP